MGTGVVVTSSITDATPAAFSTHVPHRSMQRSIARQFAVNRTVDVILGGGRAYFEDDGLLSQMAQLPTADAGTSGSLSKPYTLVQSVSELTEAKTLPLLGLFSAGDLSWEIDRDPTTTPSLRQMSEAALRLLRSSSDTGFFILIEGSKIDKAAHPNDAATMLREILQFDETVGAVLDFARTDGQTLVVITADHETGGLSLGRGVVTSVSEAEASLHTRSLRAEAKGEFESQYSYLPEVLERVSMSSEMMVAEALSSVEWESAAVAECGGFRCVLSRNESLQTSLIAACESHKQGRSSHRIE